MPTPKKGPRLGGSPAHQRLMLANLASSLFEHGALTTTEAKARQLRPFAERLITKAKRGDLHNRRQVLSIIRDKGVVHVLFTEIGPKFAERPGGYTRITKIGPRKGDNAPMAVIELVEEDFTPKAGSAKPSARTSTAATATDETAAEKPAEAGSDTADEAEVELAEEQQAVAEQEPTGEPVAEAAEEEPAVDAEPTDEADAEPTDEADAGQADEAEESADDATEEKSS